MNDKVLSIIIKARDEASQTFEEVGAKSETMGTRITKAAGLAAKAAGVALATGIGLASKASLDQVSAVQQATVALGAYEKNGAKVQGVLKSLLAYARSDAGVLFNRTDLFAAAQGLKIMGDNTDHLTEHVKIMSRSVGLGLSTWQELGLIIGRVGSTGRLTGDDFDNLTKAGYRLDPSLRNTNITFDQLFDSLNKGIPVDALQGQANTIHGLGIRFQTAFRNIGNAILGVNSDTNQFIQGGLGDRLVQLFQNITAAMKTEAVIKFFSVLGTALNIAIVAVGKLVSFFERHRVVAAALAGVIVAAMLPAIAGLVVGFFAWAAAAASAAVATIAATWPILAIGAVIGVVAYLIISHWNTIKAAFSAGVEWIKAHWALIPAILLGPLGIAIALILSHRTQIINAIGQIPGIIGGALASIGRIIAAPFEAGFNTLRGLINGAINFIHSFIAVVRSAMGAIPGAVAAGVAPVFGILTAPFQAAAGVIRGIIGGITSAISSVASLGSKVGGVLHAAHIPGFASGTSYAPGGMAWVGENGPELVNLPRGSQVIPNKESMAIAGSSGSATFNMYGNINLGDASAVDRFFERLNAQKELGHLGVGV